MIDIPYAATPRPDTGLTNARLGLWLFLASEVMLFGSLFSAYAILRTGAAAWPDQSSLLNVPLAAVNTVVLLLASVAMRRAAGAARHGAAGARLPLAAAAGAGLLFFALKSVEYRGELAHGLLPSSNNFLGLYYALTGLHALHVLGGVLASAHLWWTGGRLAAAAPARYASRVEVTATYWHFVDLVWISLFVVLYLL